MATTYLFGNALQTTIADGDRIAASSGVGTDYNITFANLKNEMGIDYDGTNSEIKGWLGVKTATPAFALGKGIQVVNTSGGAELNLCGSFGAADLYVLNFGATSTGSVIGHDNGSAPIRFAPNNGIETVRFTGDSKVGINITAPTHDLDVGRADTTNVAGVINIRAGWNNTLINKEAGSYEVEAKDSDVNAGANTTITAIKSICENDWTGAANANAYMQFSTLNANTLAERMRISSIGNVGIGATTFGNSSEKVLSIANGVAPTSNIAGQINLYSLAGELYVKDDSGNQTLLSPHAGDAPDWMYDTDDPMPPQISKEINDFDGIVRYTNNTRKNKLIEMQLNGETLPTGNAAKFIHVETFEEHNERTGNELALDDWEEYQNRTAAGKEGYVKVARKHIKA
jgi:hypothetical protein